MRKDRKGDGVSVCIYVKTEFTYNQKTDLDFNNLGAIIKWSSFAKDKAYINWMLL